MKNTNLESSLCLILELFYCARLVDPNPLRRPKGVSLELEPSNQLSCFSETYVNKIIKHITKYDLLSSKYRANGLWANNLPLFDDDKTYIVITNILGGDFK